MVVSLTTEMSIQTSEPKQRSITYLTIVPVSSQNESNSVIMSFPKTSFATAIISSITIDQSTVAATPIAYTDPSVDVRLHDGPLINQTTQRYMSIIRLFAKSTDLSVKLHGFDRALPDMIITPNWRIRLQIPAIESNATETAQWTIWVNLRVIQY